MCLATWLYLNAWYVYITRTNNLSVMTLLIYILQLQSRRMHPADVGHVSREMGFHGHFLEFCRRPFCMSSYSTIFVFPDGCVGIQTYVYSVVYMASHDLSNHQYDTVRSIQRS